jgi:ariadne-1
MPLCCCCSQVLSNSYAFAYFFFGGQLYAEEFSEDQNRVNQNLFEDSQEMLAGEVGVIQNATSSLYEQGLAWE